jgi:hypothetical protein
MCVRGLLVVPLLVPYAARAACSINVTVSNNGNASTDQTYQINWQASQFKDAGVWHALCGKNGRPACQGGNLETAPIGHPITQTFKTESGGCDGTRELKIVTQINKTTENYTSSCTVPGAKNAVQLSATLTMAWKGPTGTPTSQGCKTGAQ